MKMKYVMIDDKNAIPQQWSPPAPIQAGEDMHYELTFSRQREGQNRPKWAHEIHGI